MSLVDAPPWGVLRSKPVERDLSTRVLPYGSPVSANDASKRPNTFNSHQDFRGFACALHCIDWNCGACIRPFLPESPTAVRSPARPPGPFVSCSESLNQINRKGPLPWKLQNTNVYMGTVLPFQFNPPFSPPHRSSYLFFPALSLFYGRSWPSSKRPASQRRRLIGLGNRFRRGCCS